MSNPAIDDASPVGCGIIFILGVILAIIVTLIPRIHNSIKKEESSVNHAVRNVAALDMNAYSNVYELGFSHGYELGRVRGKQEGINEAIEILDSEYGEE